MAESTPRYAVVGLAVTHALLIVNGLWTHSPTRNEVGHIPAGLAIWTDGRFDVYSVNPPLPRAIATLPTLLADPDIQSIRSIPRTRNREEWNVATTFAEANTDKYHNLVRLSRLSGILWSLLGAFIVWVWSRDLHGSAGGLISVGVWCLGPTIVTHAQFATPDMPAAVSVLLATYLFRRYLLSPSFGKASVTGAALGIAFLSKFTALILPSAWAVIMIVFWISRGPYRYLPIRSKLCDIAWIGIVALAVLNLGYLGDGSLTPLAAYEFDSHLLSGPTGLGNRFREMELGYLPVPVPRDFLAGIDLQRVDFEGGIRSYMRGEWKDGGWWYWYLYSTSVKVPLGVLGLTGLGLTAAIRRPSAEGIAIWVPAAAIFGFVSANTGMTQHWRYVLPALPFAVVGLGATGTWLADPPRWRRLIVGGLLAWAAVSTARCYPHTLSYFNELAGGPSQGWWHLTDSNVDWGQDLMFLREWAAEHPEARPLYLGYSNFVRPQVVGVDLPPAPVDPGWRSADGRSVGPQPGYFAVEAVSLVRERTFFQRFAPFDRVGYSIFVYRLTSTEADNARREMGLPPLSDVPTQMVK